MREDPVLSKFIGIEELPQKKYSWAAQVFLMIPKDKIRLDFKCMILEGADKAFGSFFLWEMTHQNFYITWNPLAAFFSERDD